MCEVQNLSLKLGFVTGLVLHRSHQGWGQFTCAFQSKESGPESALVPGFSADRSGKRKAHLPRNTAWLGRRTASPPLRDLSSPSPLGCSSDVLFPDLHCAAGHWTWTLDMGQGRTPVKGHSAQVMMRVDASWRMQGAVGTHPHTCPLSGQCEPKASGQPGGPSLPHWAAFAHQHCPWGRG